jgi:hypothetical protein
MVERHCADAELHLPDAGRRRSVNVGNGDIAFAFDE